MRLERAAQQQAAAIEGQLAAAKAELEDVLQQVAVLEALAAFGNDGKCLDVLCVTSRIRLPCV